MKASKPIPQALIDAIEAARVRLELARCDSALARKAESDAFDAYERAVSQAAKGPVSK